MRQNSQSSSSSNKKQKEQFVNGIMSHRLPNLYFDEIPLYSSISNIIRLVYTS